MIWFVISVSCLSLELISSVFVISISMSMMINDINNHIISDMICGLSCCLSSALFLAGRPGGLNVS